jgi:hypothetical protein
VCNVTPSPACVHVCMGAWVHVCMGAGCMCACVHVCRVHVCMCACVHGCMGAGCRVMCAMCAGGLAVGVGGDVDVGCGDGNIRSRPNLAVIHVHTIDRISIYHT